MTAQTDILRNNLHIQLDQLTDLDRIKNEMDGDEYNEARQDTVDQLEEFSKSLEKMEKIERDTKIGRRNGADGARQKKEILDALKKLGQTLSNDEEIYLKHYTDRSNANFAKMNESSDVNVNALSAVAAKQIETARTFR